MTPSGRFLQPSRRAARRRRAATLLAVMGVLAVLFLLSFAVLSGQTLTAHQLANLRREATAEWDRQSALDLALAGWRASGRPNRMDISRAALSMTTEGQSAPSDDMPDADQVWARIRVATGRELDYDEFGIAFRPGDVLVTAETPEGDGVVRRRERILFRDGDGARAVVLRRALMAATPETAE